MAGVHGLKHVEGLATTHLAADDPVGTHAERVLHEVADGHLAGALEARRPRLEADDVRLLKLQLGRVLDGDHPLAVIDQRERALSSVVLPDPVPPEMMMLRRLAAATLSSLPRFSAAFALPGHRSRA